MRKKSMCVVSIGGGFFLLPVRDGVQVIELMSKAEPLAQDYSGIESPRWRLDPKPMLSSISMDLVAPDEVDRSKLAGPNPAAKGKAEAAFMAATGGAA